MSNFDTNIAIKEELKGDILILYMTGRLDAVSAPMAEHIVFDFINLGHTKLVFDFSSIDYLSSAGMRTLLSVTRKLKTFPGKLVICHVSTNVMDVLKMSGFDHVLEISLTLEDAFRRF